MNQIEAIYQGGVFKPLHTVALSENQRVRLTIQPLGADDVRAWLDQVQQVQQRVVDQRGYFPDSTADIAADRVRDE
jgi:predicted DNA-binding antitoxin AbrB/MazE fold protein